MPTRLIREGILESEAVNSLSIEAELFYRRLMSIADDYGRADGRVEILRGRLFSLQLERWTPQAVESAVAECARTCTADGTPLVSAYTVGGKACLQINNFGQRTRTKSRFPEPPNGSEPGEQMTATRGQLPANDSNSPSNDRKTAVLPGIEQNLHDPDACQQPADNCAQMSANVRTTRAQGRTDSDSKAYAKTDAKARARARADGDEPFDPDPGLRLFAEQAQKIHPDRWLREQAEAAWRSVVTSAEIEAAVFAGLERWRECPDWRDGVVHRWDRWLNQRMFEQAPRAPQSKSAETPQEGVLAKLARRFA